MIGNSFVVAGDSPSSSRPPQRDYQVVAPATGHLPTELDDPVNGLLDALETLVTTIAAMGHEAPIKARLSRIFPAPSGRLPVGESEGATERSLQLAAVLAALGIVRNRRLTEADALAVIRAKDWIKAEMEAPRA